MAPPKHALLIGVSEYSDGGIIWSDLNAAEDIKQLKEILKTKFGFRDDEIVTLTKKTETTRKGILEGFQKYLIDVTNSGDVVFFHYSGHGHQVPDPTGHKSDGLSETIVPSDWSPSAWSPKIVPDPQEIRDLELAKLIDQLKAKKPASITLSFDCCHAGSNTRGPHSAVRGRHWEGPPPLVSTTRGKPENIGGFFADTVRMDGNVFVLSATRRDQLAYETADHTPPMGRFTWALVRTLNESTQQTTYRDISDRVHDFLLRSGREQVPQVEGDLDHVLFSEKIERPARGYIPVRQTASGKLELAAGSLHGMTVDSHFALYPAGTKENDIKNQKDIKNQPVAQIVELHTTTADIALLPQSAKDAKSLKLDAARAVETGHNYGDNRLRVSFQKINKLPGAEQFIKELQQLPLVVPDTEDKAVPDVEFVPDPQSHVEGGVVILRRAEDGSTIASDALRADSVGHFRDGLEHESRWRFLQKLDPPPNSLVHVEIRLRMATIVKDPSVGEKVISQSALPDRSSGTRQLKVDDRFVIQVRNTGKTKAYVTILDLRQDGKIGPIWPHPQLAESDDNMILPGDWTTISSGTEPIAYKLDGELGLESFKVIATAEPANFMPLVDPEVLERGEAPRRGPVAKMPEMQNPLGQLLAAATAGTRASPVLIPTADWSTQTLTFEVVK